MKYFFLLTAGISVSLLHFYLVWHHRDNRKYSISEHAILDKESHLLYFFVHTFCDVLFVLYSYQFFIVEHGLYLPHYLNVCFVVLDFVQAVLPSKGRPEKIHFAAAYISWFSYLLAGVVAYFGLQIAQPYKSVSIFILLPVLGMFIYMHINSKKLYPYQLAMVPLFVIYMLLITIGAR